MAATKSFGAVCKLTREGYGADALKLSRSLFETFIVSYWMTHCADHDWVVERMREHHEYANLIWVETLAEHPSWDQLDYSDDRRERVEAKRERLVVEFGKYCERGWWEVDVAEKSGGGWKVEKRRGLRDLIDDLVGEKELEGQLWHSTQSGDEATPVLAQMYDIPQRFNNQLLHHNPSGLATFVDLEESELVFDDEPSEEWIEQAQIFAHTCYSLLVQLMIDRYEPDLREEFERTVSPVFRSAWVTLASEGERYARRGANRNKLCPCGSGWKCKDCHGRP